MALLTQLTDMDITLEMAKLARRIPLDFAPLKDVVGTHIVVARLNFL